MLAARTHLVEVGGRWGTRCRLQDLVFVSVRILRGTGGALLRLASHDPWIPLIGLFATAAGWLVREIEPWWTLGGAGDTNAHQDLLWFASAFTVGRGLVLLDRAELPWAAGAPDLRALGASLALSLPAAAVVLAVCALWSLLGVPSAALAPPLAQTAVIAAIAGASRLVCGRVPTSLLVFVGLVWLLPGLLHRAPAEWSAIGAALDSRHSDSRGAIARCLIWNGLAVLASRAAPYRR
jgi:hypothetical protein